MLKTLIHSNNASLYLWGLGWIAVRIYFLFSVKTTVSATCTPLFPCSYCFNCLHCLITHAAGRGLGCAQTRFWCPTPGGYSIKYWWVHCTMHCIDLYQVLVNLYQVLANIVWIILYWSIDLYQVLVNIGMSWGYSIKYCWVACVIRWYEHPCNGRKEWGKHVGMKCPTCQEYICSGRNARLLMIACAWHSIIRWRAYSCNARLNLPDASKPPSSYYVLDPNACLHVQAWTLIPPSLSHQMRRMGSSSLSRSDGALHAAIWRLVSGRYSVKSIVVLKNAGDALKTQPLAWHGFKQLFTVVLGEWRINLF